MSKDEPRTQPARDGSVRPVSDDRAPGKFEAVLPDGTTHPYAFRTEGEAQQFLTDLASKKATEHEAINKAAEPAEELKSQPDDDPSEPSHGKTKHHR